jgi:hypothetical protein
MFLSKVSISLERRIVFMWQTLSDLFNWQWAVQGIAWTVLGSVALRAWVWWNSGKGNQLSLKREITFWIIAPLTIMIALAFVSAGMLHNQPFAHPRLSGTVQQLGMSTDATDGRSALVQLTATIRNTGMPSAVERYALVLSRPGTETIEGTPTLPGSGETFAIAYPDGSTASLPREDFLPTKTANIIPTGGIATGVLFVKFPNVEPRFVTSGSFVLKFFDVEGTEYRTPPVPIGGRTTIAPEFFPGTHPTFSTPSISPSPAPLTK